MADKMNNKASDKIKVRPTNLLHGEIFLTNRFIIRPKEGWREIPFSPTPPSADNPRQLAEWKEVMRILDFYYNAGKLELSSKDPKKLYKKTDPFWCKNAAKNHRNVNYPAIYEGLCAYCFNQVHPETFGGKFPEFKSAGS